MPSLCHAAATQLSLAPNGDVFVCCRSRRRLGTIATSSLSELWRGSQRLAVAGDLSAGRWGDGCDACAAEVGAEGREGSFPQQFDYLDDGGDPAWPRRIDFMLSNVCNLQCVQCSGDLSSSIRAKREHRPPLGRPYGDAFFADVELFLPHLRWASFEGGEPFLARENFRVWDAIGRVNPQIECVVCTNATKWNDAVRDVVSSLAMDVIVSLDGITAATYEEVRIDADFDQVMANIDHLSEVVTSHGRRFSINHCLMPQNVDEFASLLLWADSRGFPVQVSVVRDPASCSLMSLPLADLAEVLSRLERRDAAVRSQLGLNRSVWARELARLRTWAQGSGDGSPVALTMVPTFLGLDVHGAAGRTTAGAEWVRDGGQPGELIIGRDERIRACDERASEVLGGAAQPGRPIADITAALRRLQVVFRDGDEMRITAAAGGVDLRLWVAVDRDDAGVAQVAVVSVAPAP